MNADISERPFPFVSAQAWIDLLCSSRHNGEKGPRCVFVWAHPDDESVGASYLVARVPHATFVYVTDGAPRDGGDARAAGFATSAGYARARLQEAKRALSLSPVPRDAVYFLNVTDQQCTDEMPSIARDLLNLFREMQPDVVVTQPYEGGHPDNDSTALAVHAACALLHKEARPVPVILEATAYHNVNGGFGFGHFLPNGASDIAEIQLSEEDQSFKKRLIACYETQQQALRSVCLDTERFRVAPSYDFSAPPHRGTLLYELYSWNMTSPRWCRMARATLQVLGIEESVPSVVAAER